MNFVIRPMTHNDTFAVSELEKECFAVPWSKESLDNELDNKMARYFVAEDNGEVIGYIGMWLVLEEAQVMNVAVSANARRCGVGSALVEMAYKTAWQNGAEQITLEVRVSNAKAISLYKKHGFKEVGVRKAYYRDNHEDALIMMKGNAGTGGLK